jgi:hypothetical protein
VGVTHTLLVLLQRGAGAQISRLGKGCLLDWNWTRHESKAKGWSNKVLTSLL